MSIFQADLIHHTAILAAIKDLRKNKFVLDDALSQLKSDPLLKGLYGEKEIQRFKKFIDKEILVALEHRMPDAAKFPTIVISLGPGDEDKSKTPLGDGHEAEQVDPATLGGTFPSPTVILKAVTPDQFDSETGQITFGDNVNLSDSNVFEGHFVHDNKNKTSFEILVVLDSSNLLIQDGLKLNLTGMTIETRRKSVGHNRKFHYAWETHTFKCQSTDSTELLYLWTLMIVILGRYKKVFWDDRGFNVQGFSYSHMYNAKPDDPNVLFARDITIRGRVEHSWIQETNMVIGGINTELLIADMTSPNAVRPIVDKQGWKGEGDVDEEDE